MKYVVWATTLFNKQVTFPCSFNAKGLFLAIIVAVKNVKTQFTPHI